jgi:copper chaperone CopZ
LKELSSIAIQSALADAGFDISTSQNPQSIGGISGGVNEFIAGKREKHIHQCSLCREEELHSDFNSKLVLDRHVSNLEGSRSDADISLLHVTEEKIVETDQKSSIASCVDDPDAGLFRVTLSVGGMTCSSCSGSITKTVSDLQGVSEVAVSLLSNSATVIVDHKQLVEVVVGAVEDCGFEAEVITVTQLNSLDENSISGLRTVALRIDGMFCR